MVIGQEPTSLKELFQGLAVPSMEIVAGKVISVDPLKIQLVNDEKMELNSNVVVLPKHLTTYKVRVDLADGSVAASTLTDGQHSHPDISQSGAHQHQLSTFRLSGAEMTVYNALIPGEIIYLLSFDHGKKYYVLDREGG